MGTAVDKTRSSTNGVKSALLCRYGFFGHDRDPRKGRNALECNEEAKEIQSGGAVSVGFFFTVSTVL